MARGGCVRTEALNILMVAPCPTLVCNTKQECIYSPFELWRCVRKCVSTSAKRKFQKVKGKEFHRVI